MQVSNGSIITLLRLHFIIVYDELHTFYLRDQSNVDIRL